MAATRVLLVVALGTLGAVLAAAEVAGDEYPWRPLEAVTRPAVPLVENSDWIQNPVDAFVATEHQSRGLSPAGEAPRHVLLRRVYLDLIGLPPTREELHAYLTDDSPDAYARVVEELLASPQYGERWGRHWMDIWRYSDWAGWTDGGQIRDSQPHIWRWRDWIVDSLNADKTYDRMVLEMLAGDELAPTDQDTLAATGYLARNYKMLSRETWMQDVVKHTAQAFLGMTLDCARCHDHRYDAISQEEYYRVRAIFEPHNVRMDRLSHESDTKKDGLPRAYDAELNAPTYLFIRGDDRRPDKEHPLAPAMPEAWGDVPFDVEPVSLSPTAFYPGVRPEIQRQEISEAETQLAQAQAALDEARAGKPAAEVLILEKALHSAERRLAAVHARITADRARYAQPAAADAEEVAKAAAIAERAAALAEAEEQVARAEQALVQAREASPEAESKTSDAIPQAEGKLIDAKKQLEKAQAALDEPSSEYTPLTAVYPQTSTGRRLALARWMTEPRNPLTARVAVNHIWQRHFGQALVPSVFDFGAGGRPPTHPALLDWLAAEFMQPTWQTNPAAAPPKPWSMKHLHRLIVTSSTYRMASSAAEHNPEIDPDNLYLWRMPARRLEAELVRDSILHVAGRLDLTPGGPEIDQTKGTEVNRRSIYFRHAQEKQMPFLKIFDSAAVTECYQRKESIVPQQALAMMNSEVTLTNSRALARKLTCEGDLDSDRTFIETAYETVLSRPANDQELAASIDFLSRQRTLFEGEPQQTEAASNDSADLSKPSSDPALRARENLVQVLFNHNDFVTVR